MNPRRATHNDPERQGRCVRRSISPLTLERIRTKALELFAERGYANVGMRELASHIGLGVGGFYYYFKSKEAVLFELLDELYEDLLISLDGHPDQAPLTLHYALLAHLHLYARRRHEFALVERYLGELSPDRQQVIRRQEKCIFRKLDAASHTERRPASL